MASIHGDNNPFNTSQENAQQQVQKSHLKQDDATDILGRQALQPIERSQLTPVNLGTKIKMKLGLGIGRIPDYDFKAAESTNILYKRAENESKKLNTSLDRLKTAIANGDPNEIKRLKDEVQSAKEDLVITRTTLKQHIDAIKGTMVMATLRQLPGKSDFSSKHLDDRLSLINQDIATVEAFRSANTDPAIPDMLSDISKSLEIYEKQKALTMTGLVGMPNSQVLQDSYHDLLLIQSYVNDNSKPNPELLQQLKDLITDNRIAYVQSKIESYDAMMQNLQENKETKTVAELELQDALAEITDLKNKGTDNLRLQQLRTEIDNRIDKPPLDRFLAKIPSLPPGVHYIDMDHKMIKEKRADMNKYLDGMGRVNDGDKFGYLADTKQLWSVDISKLKDKKVYSLAGKFEMTGKEIKQMVASTQVSYDGNRVSGKKISNYLSKGADVNDQDQSREVRGRCVRSKIPLVVNQQGQTISRKAGRDPLHTFNIYTMNGPNLNGVDGSDSFPNDFFDDKGTFLPDGFKTEMKALLEHYLLECKADGLDVPVVTGISMGAFLPDNLKDEGKQIFAAALKECLADPQFDFKGIVFADPDSKDPTLRNAVLGALKDDTRVTVTNKSGLDIVELGTKEGLKMGLLNPGDNSCYPGQNWEGGHFALEEMLAMFSLMVIAQHPRVCKAVTDVKKYVKRKIRPKAQVKAT